MSSLLLLKLHHLFQDSGVLLQGLNRCLEILVVWLARIDLLHLHLQGRNLLPHKVELLAGLLLRESSVSKERGEKR